MTQDIYVPRPDAVDGEFHVETRATAAATAALWTLLDLSRREPRPWIPITVLAGEPGSGRTTVATRFVNACQRNAACDLLRERVPGSDPEQDRRDGEALTRGVRWAQRMTREYGSCPRFCHPAAWVPRHLISQAVHESQSVFPAFRTRLEPRPDRNLALGHHVWGSPGNVAHHPTRRTTVMLVDDADRLFSAPASRRRGLLDRIEAWEQTVGHPLAIVLIGSPALATAVAETRTTQVIRLTPMVGPEFARVCSMITGAREPEEVAALYQSSAGLIGPVVHIARMRGLEPPYHVPPDEMVTLPALPAPD